MSNQVDLSVLSINRKGNQIVLNNMTDVQVVHAMYPQWEKVKNDNELQNNISLTVASLCPKLTGKVVEVSEDHLLAAVFGDKYVPFIRSIKSQFDEYAASKVNANG